MFTTLEKAVRILSRPVLEENPFPDNVTSRSESTLARFSGWANELRAGLENDVARLKRQDGKPDDWEVAALDRSLRQWRALEAFRQLHEERWCPALLFSLKTKTDLITLCDPEADSSADGFEERARKVLARRGIDHRFKWREARRMVSAMGLLEPHIASGDGFAGGVDAIPAASQDKSGTATDGRTASAGDVAEQAQPGASPVTPEDDPGNADTRSDLPALRLDPVWNALPTYKKSQLEAVYTQFCCGLWSQFADRFYASFKKDEMRTYVGRLVRFHACLEAVQHLTEDQLGVFFDWMQGRLGRRGHRDEDLRIAARLFGGFLSVQERVSLSPGAWSRYRDAELRRIGAFCYHRFYEDNARACEAGG